MKRIILFHQYFLGKNDAGGSRWNQFTKFFIEKANLKIDVIAGNIHYATGERIGGKTFYSKKNISDKIIVHRTWTYSGYNSNFLGRAIGYFSYTFSAFIRAFFLKSVDTIIVTSPSLFIGVAALLLKLFKRKPFIFEVRDLWPESAIATGVIADGGVMAKIMFVIESMLYKHAKKIVVLTPAFKENIEKRFPKYSDKLEIITNGADFEIIPNNIDSEKLKRKFGWKDKFVFSYFGAHGVANDLIQVVEVAQKFKDNSKLHFVLVGDGMQKKMLKQKVKEYDLNNVEFVDSVPKSEVFNYIYASDICMAILKKTDTFKTVYPNKVFDYMACSKPVFVTIEGITRKLIEDSGAGFYSEPENLEKFVEMVNKIVGLTYTAKLQNRCHNEELKSNLPIDIENNRVKTSF